MANGESLFSEYGRHIKLGHKYLNEGKYDEAILTFNKAIEIDAKIDKSYIGLAKVYITRFDKNTIDDAHNALNLGYEQSKSDNIINAYIENANQLYDNGKIDEAIELLEKGYEATKDESLNNLKEELIKEKSKEILETLIGLFEKNEIDKVKEIMISDEFKQVVENISKDSPLIYIPSDKEDGIGIYEVEPSGHILNTSYGTHFIYYGGYSDNKRSGNGIWLSTNGENTYLFEGLWQNDKPNGKGKVDISFDSGNGRIQEGNLVNGLWDGDVLWTMNFIEYTKVAKSNFKNGIATVIEETVSNGKKSYTIAKSSDYGLGFSSESDLKIRYGIEGFQDKKQ